MNSLSWLIYFADIVSNLQGVLAAVSVVLVVAMLPATEGFSKTFKGLKLYVTIAILLGAIATILPSKNTVYAIAASELGEQVLVSNTGKKAVAALEAWLDAQVKGLK